MPDRALTIRDLCDRYSVTEHTVLGWIRSGELRAINVGRSLRTKKPRWRILAESLQDFEALRTASPPPPRARRRKQRADVIDYY
jgi:excisionase family DNA binding protein